MNTNYSTHDKFNFINNDDIIQYEFEIQNEMKNEMVENIW